VRAPFELAVAAAINLFGFNSGAALATVVGMLVAAPAILTVVWIVDRSQGQYERDANQKSSGQTRHKA
jgi:ACR3 family arsenite transporter